MNSSNEVVTFNLLVNRLQEKNMPINNDLEPIELPMDLKFGDRPNTRFRNNLEALQVELVDAPTTEQARNVAWHYVKACLLYTSPSPRDGT